MKAKIHSHSPRNFGVTLKNLWKPNGTWAHLTLIKRDTILCSPGYADPTIGGILHNENLAWERVLIDRSWVGSMRSLVYILRRKPGHSPWKTAALVKCNVLHTNGIKLATVILRIPQVSKRGGHLDSSISDMLFQHENIIFLDINQ